MKILSHLLSFVFRKIGMLFLIGTVVYTALFLTGVSKTEPGESFTLGALSYEKTSGHAGVLSSEKARCSLVLDDTTPIEKACAKIKHATFAVLDKAKECAVSCFTAFGQNR